ncbi:MAG: PepSY-associated TM helix domain-containing protein [Pirellulaceae bacterium]
MKPQPDSTLIAEEPPAAASVERGLEDPRANRGQLSLRKLWLQVHRWIGLTAGLLFVLIGLTGTLLVFDHAIDEWLNPRLLLTSESGTPRSLEQILAAAERGYDGPAQQPLSVTAPRVANGVWTVWFSCGTPDNPKFAAVHVDPYTAQVTGQRVWGEYLMTWVYRLHYNLMAGSVGGTIVGIAGIVLFCSVCSGIYLWWPLFRHSWRAGFAIRGGRRFNYDLHKSVGIVSAAILLVVAFTGVYMEFPTWFKPVVALFSPTTESPLDLKSAPAAKRVPLTPDEAVAIATRHFPHAVFDHLHPPAGADGTYEVAFRQAHEVQRSYGRTQVFLDQYTGQVVAINNPDDFTAGDIFLAWQYPLHNGEAFGLVGRWIVFFSGLTPALLYGTGFLLWWRRGLARREARTQTAQAETRQPQQSAAAAQAATSRITRPRSRRSGESRAWRSDLEAKSSIVS